MVGGGVCKVIFMSNPTSVVVEVELCCVVVVVVTISYLAPQLLTNQAT